jgi:hypothetical protein
MTIPTIDSQYLLEILERDHAWTREERQSFLKLPLKERARMFTEMANLATSAYEAEAALKDRKEWQGGDIIEY